MARLLTPKVLRRGFQFSLLASVIAFGAILAYGNDLGAFVDSLGMIRWGWLVVGLGLASMDWIGGGLRLWVTCRVIHPDPPLGGLMMAGGMSAFGGYVTPLQSGNGPMLLYTMKRYGVPIPVAVTSALMSFISTIVFFAIVGPMAIILGAGKSLETRGNLLGLSLYDLFLGSLTVFAGVGVVLLLIIAFPRLIARLIRRGSELVGRRSVRAAARLEAFQSGVDRAQASVLAFTSWQGAVAMLWATLLTGVSHANKLLAGYVTLRALGIQAGFVDVLLLQTLIMFLLYFAPTPGGAGLAEVVSALVMGIYVSRELTPVYILIWRLIQTYFTVAAGSVVFWYWVRQGLKGIEQDHPVPSTP